MCKYILILDNRASGKNWYFWFNEYFKLHPKIAKDYEIRTAKTAEEKSVDLLVLNADTKKSVFIAELKQDDFTDFKQLYKEIHQTYIKKLNQYNLKKLYLICSPSVSKRVKNGEIYYLDNKYESAVVNRMIGLMNHYKWINLHILKNPLKAIDKIDKLIRKPELVITHSLPVYVNRGAMGFTQSLYALIPGLSLHAADYLAEFWHQNITEKEIAKHLKEFTKRLRSKKALSNSTQTKVWKPGSKK